MTLIGSALAALFVVSLVLGMQRPSRVSRRLEQIVPRGRVRGAPSASDLQRRQAGLWIDGERFLAVRVTAALSGVLALAAVTLVLPLGPAVLLLGGYAGAIAPTLIVEHRATARRAHADREVATLVERLDALVSAGRPPENALALLLHRVTGAYLLDEALRQSRDAHALGAPLFRTLGTHAREIGLDGLAAMADELERARDLGVGAIGAIRQRRDALRAAERSRALSVAAQVEGKLMLILVLCYLPALVLLVVVPLFIGLLEGLTT